MALKASNKIFPEFSLSSMTDIVFLLLIFFLLTSNITESIDLSLPKAEGKATQSESLTISIDKNANYYIGKNRIDFQNLEKRFIDLAEKHEKISIVLKSDKSVPIEKAIAVVNIANKNGIKILLAVTSQ